MLWGTAFFFFFFPTSTSNFNPSSPPHSIDSNAINIVSQPIHLRYHLPVIAITQYHPY